MIKEAYHFWVRYTLNQIEAFYWVVRAGGVHAAAAQLNLTQPAVSMRIKELERMLGGALFDRGGYRVALSDLGQLIYTDAEEMIRRGERIHHIATGSISAPRLVRLGVAESFAARILPGLMAELSRAHHHIKLDITVDTSRPLEALLTHHVIDMAIVADPVSNDDARSVPIWSVDVCWVVGRELDFPSGVVTPAMLVDIPIFTTSAPSPLRSILRKWFGSDQLEPRNVSSCNSYAISKRLVRAGLGATLLPVPLLELDGEDRDLVALTADPPLTPHSVCAMWWPGTLANQCQTILDLSRQLIAREIAQQAHPG